MSRSTYKMIKMLILENLAEDFEQPIDYLLQEHPEINGKLMTCVDDIYGMTYLEDEFGDEALLMDGIELDDDEAVHVFELEVTCAAEYIGDLLTAAID